MKAMTVRITPNPLIPVKAMNITCVESPGKIATSRVLADAKPMLRLPNSADADPTILSNGAMAREVATGTTNAVVVKEGVAIIRLLFA